MRAERRLAAVMFTDMEGFTALMQSDEDLALVKRDRYTGVLEELHEVFGGTIVQFFGDGSLSTFPNSVDAVECAVAIQKAFQEPVEVPVRIGIHVGHVLVQPTGLVGDAVNIASRIESFGFPGAVMISDSVRDQVRNQARFDFVDLGKFKLKNVVRPFAIYAISVPGLTVPASDALRGKGERLASLPANLPDPPFPLLGREADLATVSDLLAEHRVVTITGPGGIGKTRTAVEVCRRSGPEFLGGVSFVEMSDVADPAEVVHAIADSLDVKEADGRSHRDGIVSLIGDRKALLLLDNMEQVIEAAPAIADVVTACPHLRLVVTSRTPLRIGPEREYRLAPLPLPPSHDGVALDHVARYAAVALFTERARAVNPEFVLNADNIDAVADICRRMDGLPLAIELAAARIRLLAPEALLARLGHALDLLTGGMRDMPERQQTLRATIDWSYSLLGDSEQRLFRRMAVFPGEATVDAIETICSEPDASVLDDLESLVAQALVVARGGSFSMLSTISEFAAERLSEVEEVSSITDRHASYYAGVATEIGAGIVGTSQLTSIERGVAEEHNIHAALDHLARAGSADSEAIELGMAAVGDLWMYWHIRGKHLSAYDYARAFLDASPQPSRERARVLNTAGVASWTLRRYEQAIEEWSASYRLAEELGDRHTMTIAAVGLALVNIGIDLAEAVSWATVSTEVGRDLDPPFLWSFALAFHGILLSLSGDAEAASARLEQALAIQEPRGDYEGAGISLGGLAQLAVAQGDTAAALELYERSRLAFEAIGDRAEEARVFGEMAWAHLAHSDADLARRAFLDSARAYEDVGSIPGVGTSMIGLASVEAAEGSPQRAVTMASAADRFAEEEGIVNVYSEDSPGHPYLEAARAQLSIEAISEAELTGRGLSVKQALAMVKG